MNGRILDGAWALLLILGVLVAVAFISLCVMRLALEAHERVDARRRDEVREIFFALMMGEPDEREAARAELIGRSGRRWALAEDQAFRMLPKIAGDSRATLRELLMSRDSGVRAERRTRSRSGVRRCRGAHRLGALGQSRHVELLLPLLGDRDFLVRRTTVRALAHIGDPAAVGPLLQIAPDSRMTRDLTTALGRIGFEGAPTLREALARSFGDSAPMSPDELSRAQVATSVLGLIEDIGAIDLLCRILHADAPALRLGAAESLGQIGSPDAVPALVAATTADDPALRTAAARALGQIGAPEAADGLRIAIENPQRDTARAAGRALIRLGEPGLLVLAESSAPVAVEALAVTRLRNSR